MLEKLYLKNFRNHGELRLNFNSPVVVLNGANGVGKSNVLEAINFLSLLRSFRTQRIGDLIKLDASGFLIMAQISETDSPEKIVLKIEQEGKTRRLFVNHEEIKRSSAFIRKLRTVVFAPEDRNIVKGPAAFRRKFFDVLISMEEPEYLQSLQNYQSALNSRNMLLKNENVAQMGGYFDPFEEILALNSEIIIKYRKAYAQIICDGVNGFLRDFGKFTIEYKVQSDIAPLIKNQLRNNREKDILKGITSSGIHLDDFEMRLDGLPLRSFGSSGQTRIISLFIKMSEFQLIHRHNENLIALVDDVCGELDAVNRNKFYQLLKAAQLSIFTLTAMPSDDFFVGAQEIKIQAQI